MIPTDDLMLCLKQTTSTMLHCSSLFCSHPIKTKHLSHLAILATRPNHSARDNNNKQSAWAAAAAYSSSFSLTLALAHTFADFCLFYPRWAAVAAAAAFRGSHKWNPKTATCFSPPLWLENPVSSPAAAVIRLLP